MHNTFISVIALVYPDKQIISDYLLTIYKVLKENFEYYEIILINNCWDSVKIKEALNTLDQDIKKDITLLNLSKHTYNDNAVVAGLDRANGDYTVIFDMNLSPRADLIIDLYKKTQENFDIVYLKYRERKLPLHKLIFFKMFYFIMNRYSDLDIDIKEHNCRIVSRRALNSILKMRESLRYMRGIFSFVGYNSTGIEVDIPDSKTYKSFPGHMLQSQNPPIKSAAIAIISFTNVLHKILLIIFIVALAFSCFVTVDALVIKLFGIDLFGDPQENTQTGYLIIFISVMFSLLFLILYIFSVYISSMNKEIRRRPLYFIQSMQRID